MSGSTGALARDIVSLRACAVQYERAMGELGWTMANVEPQKILDRLEERDRLLTDMAAYLNEPYSQATARALLARFAALEEKDAQ